MHVFVTLLIILFSFRDDNLSKLTDTKWLFNNYVWLLLCLLITLTCEHQAIHIFMSYLEVWSYLLPEPFQKIWSSSDNKSSTCKQCRPMVFLPSSHDMSSNSSTTSGVSCGTVARYAPSAGGNIDAGISASSPSDMEFFSFLISVFICSNHHTPFLFTIDVLKTYCVEL